MALNYTALAATAHRLIRDNGFAVTMFNNEGTAPVYSGQPFRGTTPVIVQYTGRAVLLNRSLFSDNDKKTETVIDERNKLLLLSPQVVNPDGETEELVCQTLQKVTFNSETWTLRTYTEMRPSANVLVFAEAWVNK